MFEGLFQPTHLLVIFRIALLVFGGKKIPELGKGIGEGIRSLKSAMKEEEKTPPTTTDIARSREVEIAVETALMFRLGLMVFGLKPLRAMLFEVVRTKNLG